MKKTLIALAAVAAASSAMAQVTIGGTYTVRLSDVNGAASPTISLADSNVNITATEDLGNGLKATLFAESEFGGRLTSSEADAAHSAVGRDVKLTVAGAFGTLTMGDYEAGQTHAIYGYGDAPVAWADDDTVISAGTNVAGFGYTAPKFGDFTFAVSGTSTNATIDAMTYTFAVAYKAGALSAKADWNESSKRVRVGATYDLGVAKLGFGAQTNQTKDATKHTDDDQMVASVTVPLGALTVGGAYSENRDTGGAATEFGASYALSKRTTLTANVRDYNSLATGQNDGWRVQVSHSF